MHDDLFERLLVQSHRRGKTISEYVAAILEKQVPDHRATGGRAIRVEPTAPAADAEESAA